MLLLSSRKRYSYPAYPPYLSVDLKVFCSANKFSILDSCCFFLSSCCLTSLWQWAISLFIWFSSIYAMFQIVWSSDKIMWAYWHGTDKDVHHARKISCPVWLSCTWVFMTFRLLETEAHFQRDWDWSRF